MSPRVDVAHKPPEPNRRKIKSSVKSEYVAIAKSEQDSTLRRVEAKRHPALKRIRKRSQYSSLEKIEDAFDTELHLMQKPKRSRTNGKVGKVSTTQQLVGALVCAKIGAWTKCGEPVFELCERKKVG